MRITLASCNNLQEDRVEIVQGSSRLWRENFMVSAKLEAFGSIPSCAAYIFPFLCPSASDSVFFLGQVC